MVSLLLVIPYTLFFLRLYYLLRIFTDKNTCSHFSLSYAITCDSVPLTLSIHLLRGLPFGLLPANVQVIIFFIRYPSAHHACPARCILILLINCTIFSFLFRFSSWVFNLNSHCCVSVLNSGPCILLRFSNILMKIPKHF